MDEDLGNVRRFKPYSQNRNRFFLESLFMKTNFHFFQSLSLYGLIFMLAFSCGCVPKADREIMNVSYDPTREFYEAYNEKFIERWAAEHDGEVIAVDSAHGGSGSQAKKVADGLQADVVTLALGYDVELIGEKIPGALKENWTQEFENNSCPYFSTIVFLVKKGNPKNIQDWSDLAKEDVAVVTPNPRTSGGARWNYLAAWGWQLKQDLGTLDPAFLNAPANAEKVAQAQKNAFEFVKKIHLNAKNTAMPEGARAATNIFVRDGVGDVLIAWENEALVAVRDGKNADFEIVYPSLSIAAEPPVAIINTTVDTKGTRDIAEAYLKYMYTPEIQHLIMEHCYRPCRSEILAEKRDVFKDLELFMFGDVFGTWKSVQEEHFSSGGLFEQMMSE